MTIEKLIDEYKGLVRNCHETDYSDKKSVKRNNASVTRMHAIVDKIWDEFGPEGIQKLQILLDTQDDGTNLWVATHLLEKTALDRATEDKALSIIEKVASGDDVTALGYRYWIRDWKSKRNR